MEASVRSPSFPIQPHSTCYCRSRSSRGNDEARQAFTVTLEKMARGGVYDQLAGGFHRYSVDERWVVPHFEKMLYDNTELLRNYVHGFRAFVREDFLTTAREIVGWLDGTMTDRERGGFYASQDADVGLDDDGDYFTWTLDEARAVLEGDELEVAAKYWDIGELGDMHHNPAKNVLHVKQSLEEIADESGRQVATVRALIESARRKLLAARLAAAHAVYRPHALHGLERDGGDGVPGSSARAAPGGYAGVCVAHARPHFERSLGRRVGAAPCVSRIPTAMEPAEQAPGTLDDYAFMLHACIDGWLAGGEMKYYRAAIKLADAMIAQVLRSRGRSVLRCRLSRQVALAWEHWWRGASLCRIRLLRRAIPRPRPACCGWRR